MRTPNIDWIGGGTRLRRHITPNQMCQPSRAAFFTGLYPRHNLVHRNGTTLPETIPTVPRVLADAGYTTYAAGKLHFQAIMAPARLEMPESLGFWRAPGAPEVLYDYIRYEMGLELGDGAQLRQPLRPEAVAWRGPFYGFDYVDLVIGESLDVIHGGHYAAWLAEHHPELLTRYGPDVALSTPPTDLWEVWKCAIPWEHHYNTWIADRTCDFLHTRKREQPFFAFVSFPDPHHPFSPPAPYCNRHAPRDVPMPRSIPGELERMPGYLREEPLFRAEHGSQISTIGLSEDTLRLAIAHYYGSIELIDDAVGRVLDTLRAQNALDETLVVFSSDHGELLGDHGFLRKGPSPYRQLLEVPFLVRGPGLLQNRDLVALTSHLDVMPTLADWAGLAAPPTDGVSLLPLLQGESSSVREAAIGEYHSRLPELYNRTIVTNSWRLTRYEARQDWGELFNYETDPGEHRNLFGEPGTAEIVRELTAELDAALPPQAHVNAEILGRF